MVVKCDLLVDGQAFPYTQFSLTNVNFGTLEAPDVRPTYGLWVSHDRLTNGLHQFQLRTTLRLDNSASQNTPFLTMVAPSFVANVNNPLQFGGWTNLIVGNSVVFKARSSVVPANWYIEIYDAWGHFLREQSGTTSDGNISWTWDLRDEMGQLHDIMESDPYFDPWVTVTATGATGGDPQPSPVSRPAPYTVLDYPNSGGWIVAYQDRDKKYAEAKAAIFEAAWGVIGGVQQMDLPASFVFLKYGKDIDPNETNAQIQRDASWDVLREELMYPINRNFYYLGHGSGFDIGGDYDRLDAKGDIVGAEIVTGSHLVGTNEVWASAHLDSGWAWRLSPLLQDAPHPYRFVFLDGCATAAGDWPWAFGIGTLTNDLAYYQHTNQPPTRPSAFAGWAETTYYSYPAGNDPREWGDYQKYAFFRSQWIFNWVNNGLTPLLTEALSLAQQSSGWVSPSKYNQIMRIYGYQQLRANEYNRRSDWPTQ